MAGYLIPIVPKRLVNFATVAVNKSASVVLADRVDVVHWRELTIIVRVHSLSLAATNTIVLSVLPQSWTPEEPGQTFVAASGVSDVLITSSTPSPSFLTAVVPTNAYGTTQVMTNLAQLTITGNRLAVGALSVEISVDFSGKDT